MLQFILQKHFKSDTFASFERQLYLYGFKKKKNKDRLSEYINSKINKDNISLLSSERRKRNLQTKEKGYEEKTNNLKLKIICLKSQISCLEVQLEKAQLKKDSLTEEQCIKEKEVCDSLNYKKYYKKFCLLF